MSFKPVCQWHEANRPPDSRPWTTQGSSCSQLRPQRGGLTAGIGRGFCPVGSPQGGSGRQRAARSCGQPGPRWGSRRNRRRGRGPRSALCAPFGPLADVEHGRDAAGHVGFRDLAEHVVDPGRVVRDHCVHQCATRIAPKTTSGTPKSRPRPKVRALHALPGRPGPEALARDGHLLPVRRALVDPQRTDVAVEAFGDLEAGQAGRRSIMHWKWSVSVRTSSFPFVAALVPSVEGSGSCFRPIVSGLNEIGSGHGMSLPPVSGSDPSNGQGQASLRAPCSRRMRRGSFVRKEGPSGVSSALQASSFSGLHGPARGPHRECAPRIPVRTARLSMPGCAPRWRWACRAPSSRRGRVCPAIRARGLPTGRPAR